MNKLSQAEMLDATRAALKELLAWHDLDHFRDHAVMAHTTSIGRAMLAQARGAVELSDPSPCVTSKKEFDRTQRLT